MSTSLARAAGGPSHLFRLPTPGAFGPRADVAARRRRTTLYQWKQESCRRSNRTERALSHLFGIYSALQILFPAQRRADEWVRKPNTAPLFGGRSALDRMLGGQVADLFVVRQYLDAQRGGKA